MYHDDETYTVEDISDINEQHNYLSLSTDLVNICKEWTRVPDDIAERIEHGF